MNNKRLTKKGIAAFLAFTLSLSLAWQPYGESKAVAASSKGETYIKELKVFAEAGADEEDAKEWCESQPENKDHDKTNDWDYVEGNLNKGASAALTREVGVFLVFQTTDDPNEAITDLAVMNEQGNYSASDYKEILKKQEETYRDMVSDMNEMLEEYRKNVKNNVETALQAKKFLNGYKEDDSGQPLGDFLMDASNDKLVQVLMQANGRVVLMIQEKLAYACDTANSTWLERMQKLGSYKALRSKALTAYKNDANKADKGLDKKYKDKAVELAASWDDIRTHISHCKEYIKTQGLDTMSESDYKAWDKKTQKDDDANLYRDEAPVIALLGNYSYEDGTLLDYFSREISADNIDELRQIYPMVASLTEGQQAAVNESVSLFTMVMNASASSAFNKKNEEQAKQTNADMSTEDNKNVESVENELDDSLDQWEKHAISIYDGVDREVYKDGVAVTSAAKSYSNGVDKNWAEVFVDSGAFRWAAVGTLLGSGIFAAGALATCVAQTKATIGMMGKVYAQYRKGVNYQMAFDKNMNLITIDYDAPYYYYDAQQKGLDNVGFYYDKSANEAASLQNELGKEELMKKALRDKGNVKKLDIINKLKIGLTVASIILVTADIIMTSVTLYKYYNRDHLPIPHHMVDMSYNKAKEASYVAYRSVLDTEGNYSDLNGGGGKQWLALYATHDSDAGKPILAPEGDATEFVYQTGKTDSPGKEYSPLHLFGTNSTPQNLTFADGDNGWSFNDKENGIYLFFKRSDKEVSDSSQAGTAMSGGVNVLLGAICVVIGGFVGFVLADTRRKKMIKKDDKK